MSVALRLAIILLASAGLFSPAAMPAQNDISDANERDLLRVTAGWDVARHQSHDVRLSFALSRPLRPDDGRLAVIVGRADLSALVEMRGERALLPLRGERLPPGDLDIEAWLVGADGVWRELGRFPLKRLTRAGFESKSVRPNLDVQSEGQLHARPAVPTRGNTYQDVTLKGGIDGALRKRSWDVGWEEIIVGASHEPARLRAAQLGPRAPMMDLASYALRLSRGPFGLAAGHISVGNHRLLASQFRSRGVEAGFSLGPRARLSIGSVAGSELVGWSDPSGIERPVHRVVTGALGVEAVPAKPGLLRMELTALNGSLQPLPGFTQQAVTDRETSRGLGGQLIAADPLQRLRLTLGLAQSRFGNPRDPALARDSSIVPVRVETKQARFGELTLDALRDAKLGRMATTLSLAVRHERTDPLYRSVAAFVQADRQQDVLEATGALGPLQWQASTASGRDNLADVPSLLITRNRAHALNAALNVASLIGAAPGPWWAPALTVTWQGTTQRGDTTPSNGGFRAPFQIPNQYTGNLTAVATWQRTVWNASYRLNRSLVDNRQSGQERSDFAGDVHGLTLGVTPSPRLTLALDLSRETQRNKEAGTLATNRRLGTQADWRPFGRAALAGALSLVLTRDDASTQRGRNLELRFEASHGFNVWVRTPDGSQARAFVRWASTGTALRLAGEAQPSVSQRTLSGGMSLRFF